MTRDGQALRLEHEELFDVLADHIDLLQGLFSGVLNASQAEARLDRTSAELASRFDQ